MPKISIVVPICNVERYLNECLNSIINQTLQDIEIICVNDGSTDGSLAIINQYANNDKRIIVVNKENTGYGNSMNIGINYATGDYIGIVESDDFAALDMFEQLYNIAVQNSADVVKSNYYEYRSTEVIHKLYTENLKECQYDDVFTPTEHTEIFNVNCSIWSGIYQRDFLRKNNIQFHETPGASYQDTSFAFQVWACAERVYLLRDAFINYRTDNAGSSSNSPDKVFCVFEEFKEIEKFIRLHPDKKDILNKVLMIVKYRTYRGFYHLQASAFQFAFLLRMAEEAKRDFSSGLLKAEDFTAFNFEELCNIMNHTNQYFKKTAKDYYDERLRFYNTLNAEMEILGLRAITDKYKKIIIYGAGIIGQRVAKKLIGEKSDISQLSFAVTEIPGNPESLLGIPVYCINELMEEKEDSLVLVSVKDSLKYEIMKTLTTLEFHNILLIDELIMKTLKDEYQ